MLTSNPIVEEDLTHIHQAVGAHGEFDGATLLITGCAGFLGFYLTQYFVRYAQELGLCKVIGLDNYLLEHPTWLRILSRTYPEILQLHSFDISRSNLHEISEARDARYVIHAASIASPTFYRQYPIETIDANIWGLRKLLDFFREEAGLKGLLFFSSSEIYGDPDARFIPTNEEYRGNVSCVGARACYDEAKRFGETLCSVFAKTHGLPVIVTRPFNNYGPGMRPGDHRLPADLADSIVAGRDLILLSDGSPTRTYCYVADAIAGYILCLLHGRFDYFNIGADKPEISVRALAELYSTAGKELFAYSGQVSHKRSEDPHYLSDNPARRCPDIRKARAKLGFELRVDIEEGVRRHLRFLYHTQSR